jgi:hypothetical protein
MAESFGKKIEPWLKRRSETQKWLLLALGLSVLGLFWFFELRGLWRWMF